jgi:hypothetical protein
MEFFFEELEEDYQSPVQILLTACKLCCPSQSLEKLI